MEKRNDICFFFPAFLLDHCSKEVRELWHWLVWLSRANLSPNETYHGIPKDEVKELRDDFMMLWKSIFGDENINFGVHNFGHTPELREDGDFCERRLKMKY